MGTKGFLGTSSRKICKITSGLDLEGLFKKQHKEKNTENRPYSILIEMNKKVVIRDFVYGLKCNFGQNHETQLTMVTMLAIRVFLEGLGKL